MTRRLCVDRKFEISRWFPGQTDTNLVRRRRSDVSDEEIEEQIARDAQLQVSAVH